ICRAPRRGFRRTSIQVMEGSSFRCARLPAAPSPTAARPRARSSSALGQLQLDAPIAPISFFRRAGVEGLELAEARGHEALGRNAAADQILNYRDCARG